MAFTLGFGGLYPCPEVVRTVLSAEDGKQKSILDLGQFSFSRLNRVIGSTVSDNVCILSSIAILLSVVGADTPYVHLSLQRPVPQRSRLWNGYLVSSIFPVISIRATSSF